MEKNRSAHPASEIDGSDLAAKLNELFETMHAAGTPQLSNYAAAKGIEEKTRVSLSPQYLSQIRSGKKTNISVVNLRAIAEYFGVPAGYLIESGTDERIKSQLGMLRVLRDAGVRDIATRAAGLSPQALVNVAALIDRARALEQLPPVEPPDEASTNRGR
ncbi:helix-turn-helix transcriptional regulator [Mycobacterium sp. CBMA271]|uniref:helix-turn-helix domain-containing protein n=1 Tax=unclassified Mycobacteroides TaxID=2618759 RepID=UPI0012DECCBC|nr:MULTISPECIES: helix-turn-helix transcriptional regulator [unclassified Mycobacteroides]MUM15513.1 XRE family transcriptional regulator [Mycobacteroides sp. CBMA 326]MUM21779.1 helix-turn-helix transcriptional regulator [Mycobacteroides sp. CBMA 271]